jgi:signal transduction histidine kinase
MAHALTSTDDLIGRLMAENAALRAEVDALADANVRAAELMAELEETRALEAELRRRGEEQKIQLALAAALLDARDPADLLRGCLRVLQQSVGLDLRPLGAYLREPRHDRLRRVEPAGEHDLPELPVVLPAPATSTVAAALEDDVLTLWLFGKGRAIGALCLRAPRTRAWRDRWMRPASSFSLQIGLALDRAIIADANSRMAEQLSAASQAKSRLLANVSHELRTPLNAIVGYSELLFEQCQEDGHADHVDDLRRILAASRHLLSLIEDLLDISRIEAGRTELRPVRIDLAALLADLHDLSAPLAVARGNHLSFSTECEITDLVADPRILRQCLLNLLSNACKYTDHGTITLRVTATEERIVFAVEDTGIGIDPREQARIFEAFVRADDPEALRRGGTGLGLTITRRFVESMGGELVLRSAPERGSCFQISLPRAAPAV